MSYAVYYCANHNALVTDMTVTPLNAKGGHSKYKRVVPTVDLTGDHIIRDAGFGSVPELINSDCCQMRASMLGHAKKRNAKFWTKVKKKEVKRMLTLIAEAKDPDIHTVTHVVDLTYNDMLHVDAGLSDNPDYMTVDIKTDRTVEPGGGPVACARAYIHKANLPEAHHKLMPELDELLDDYLKDVDASFFPTENKPRHWTDEPTGGLELQRDREYDVAPELLRYGDEHDWDIVTEFEVYDDESGLTNRDVGWKQTARIHGRPLLTKPQWKRKVAETSLRWSGETTSPRKRKRA